jgi:hypothetical protein
MTDTAINTRYDHETEDVAGLVDDLMAQLRAVVSASPAKPARRAKPASPACRTVPR